MNYVFLSDPYVKVYLVCEGKRIRKKRTSVKRSSLNPFYNEALLFDVPASNVNDVSLIIKVIDYDRYVPASNVNDVSLIIKVIDYDRYVSASNVNDVSLIIKVIDYDRYVPASNVNDVSLIIKVIDYDRFVQLLTLTSANLIRVDSRYLHWSMLLKLCELRGASMKERKPNHRQNTNSEISHYLQQQK
ncbi:hypothetical protein WDU94_012139 [Cyamophila willieti]